MKKRVQEAEVRKVCRLSDDIRLNPSEVLVHAERIESWVEKRGGKYSFRGRIALFKWASQELDVPLHKFENGNYYPMEGVRYASLVGLFIALIFRIDMTLAITLGGLGGLLIGMRIKKSMF